MEDLVDDKVASSSRVGIVLLYQEGSSWSHFHFGPSRAPCWVLQEFLWMLVLRVHRASSNAFTCLCCRKRGDGLDLVFKTFEILNQKMYLSHVLTLQKSHASAAEYPFYLLKGKNRGSKFIVNYWVVEKTFYNFKPCFIFAMIFKHTVIIRHTNILFLSGN